MNLLDIIEFIIKATMIIIFLFMGFDFGNASWVFIALLIILLDRK